MQWLFKVWIFNSEEGKSVSLVWANSATCKFFSFENLLGNVDIFVAKSEIFFNSDSLAISSGMLSTFSLKPNYIDKKNGYYKGINLSGTTSKNKFDVKLYLTYNTEDKQIERYIILHGNATW